MRVLQINKFFYRRGGAETYFFEVSKLLEKAGHEVIHFSMEHTENEPSPYANYFVSSLDLRESGHMVKKAARLLFSFEVKKKLEQLIRDHRPDIAHLHNIYHHLSPSVLTVLKQNKIPIVMTLHDYKLACPNYRMYTKGSTCERCNKHKFYNAVRFKCLLDSKSASLGAMVEMYVHKLFRLYERDVDQFIAPSEFLKNKLVEWGQDEKKIIHIKNPVDTSVYAVASESKSYLLYVGRLTQEKGIHTLLEAMKELPDVPLRIVGIGPLAKEVEDFVTHHPQLSIAYLGYKKGEELYKQIQEAAGVVVPSEWYENNPYSALEAMSMGVPVLASCIGGLPEIVRDGENGFLFGPGNIVSLRDTVRKFFASDRKRLGQNARDFVEREHNPAEHIQKIEEIYCKLTSEFM